VARPWTRAELLTYWTLVVTVGGGLLVVATQVQGLWAGVCRVAGIVLVVIGIPGGMLLPLLARTRTGENGEEQPERPEAVEKPSPRGDLAEAIRTAHQANDQLEDDLHGKRPESDSRGKG